MSYHRGGDGKPRGFGFSGFSLMSRAERAAAAPPPPSAALSKQGYSTMTSITENALNASWGIPKKRTKTEDEYFEEEDETPKLDYIPAPGSPGGNPPPEESEDEEDPLDAFMAGIESQVKAEAGTSTAAVPKKGIRVDIDSEDVEESYYKYMEENPKAGLQDEESDTELMYDEDGNPIAPKKSKYIDPLPPIDHSTITYSEFKKDFYKPHEEIEALDDEQVAELRGHLGVTVSGFNPPKPVTSFGHFGFDDQLIKAIRKSEFTQPTPIQSQAIPAALMGRDVIGIAKTGSGKTAAFLWPMLTHIMAQRELSQGEGPIGLILAPTRELSQQIYTEARKFGKIYNLNVVCAYGGGSKWEQSKALEEGAEIVVATPGRMIDLIKMKATNLERVTFLVLDEADRMFELGFEAQVRSICDHVRPDRQTLLFSATFKKKIEKLARDVLIDPVRILYGDVGYANADVEQKIVMILPTNKLPWLLGNLVDFTSAGSVLIFVTRKLNAEEVATQLKLKEIDCLLLHGDVDQIERNRVITAFKKRECDVLVATDVAARGLDIPHIRTVINYELARDIDTHTHRVGRTGRAGTKGTAYSLVTSADKEFAGHLVRNLEGANQEVPRELFDLATTSNWFKKSRFKNSSGSANVGGAGLGYKEPSVHQSQPSGPKPVKTKSGPAMDRLSAIKSAFKAQYESQFTASPENAEQLQMLQSKKRKKSRWDTDE
ncbi:hypothetical protein GE061_008695 [Apolygus lucorum]|uniref:RNA helicase n=1 Tax=Apolygus lucorum TaxID=248454 RepID=A0A6A4J001_APOLU|nr:hypothetical protein GE061_008695 [Apolygus lucorum]